MASCPEMRYCDVEHCPRCNGEHLSLAFMPLTNPVGHVDVWFAECPYVKEPMMATIATTDRPMKPEDLMRLFGEQNQRRFKAVAETQSGAEIVLKMWEASVWL